MREKTLDTRFARDWWKRQFELQACEYRLWKRAATQFKYAADTLLVQANADGPKFLKPEEPPPMLYPVILMLYGLAIETIAKAILVKKESPLDGKGRVKLQSHDLVQLVRKVGLSLSVAEEHLLKRLTAFVKWAGKYPVPLTFDDMQPFQWPDKSFAPIHGGMGGNDFKDANAIFERLMQSV